MNAPEPELAELVAFLTDRPRSEGGVETNPHWLRALGATLGRDEASALLHRALERVPASARRVALFRELHSVDEGSVAAAASRGDSCAQHVMWERLYAAGESADALVRTARDAWPLDAAVVEKALRDAATLEPATLRAVLDKLGLAGATYRQASVLAKRAAALSAERRAALALPAVKVALLGDVTTDYLRPLLATALLEQGMDGTVRAGGFGELEEAVLDPASWLVDFGPDVVVVLGSTLTLPPTANQTWPDVLQRRTRLCELVATHLGADTIVTNLEPLPEHTGPGGAPAWLNEYNARLRESLPERAFVFDLAALVAETGTGAWFDLRLWSMARQATGLGVLPLLADRLGRFVGSLREPRVKLIVTDLDNVLWGGTVAEVGADALQIGGNDLGVAHVRLQELLRDAAANGFLLAVCSKNTENAARSPFEKRPEMALSLDDFVDFAISFLPKSVTLPEIAQRLNLGLQNVLFLDDEPHERAEMRERHPEMIVPEWPENGIVGLPELLARSGWLTRLRATAADAQRVQHYKDEAKRRTTSVSYSSLDEFLDSLDLVARFAPIGPDNLERVAQLVQKTNQFNLTTFRYSRRELEERLADEATYGSAVDVEDRYGPYGLTGVLLATQRDTALVLDLWLMSCRVMGKTVELAMFDHVLRHARERGIDVVEGLFRPTDKNGPVSGLLPELGFKPAGSAGDVQRFHFPVHDDPKRRNRHVTIIDDFPEKQP